MAPILVQLGPVTLYSYGVMMAVAFGVATWLAVRAARRLPPESRALSPDMVVDATCAALFGGIVGGRLFYVALHAGEFRRAPLEVFAIWHGGLVWYGGFLGGLLGGWLYVRGQRVPFLLALDQLTPFVALGHALGRLGCFLNGCCYGASSDAWCAVQFPGLPGPVLPTQLFEAAGLLVIYGALSYRMRRAGPARPGRMFIIYALAYGVLRFMLEFFRGDQTVFLAGMTLQQVISLALIAAGLVLLRRKRA
jgi:phosphatidylglycerol:prolipoprotein diacylglycerol transferase